MEPAYAIVVDIGDEAEAGHGRFSVVVVEVEIEVAVETRSSQGAFPGSVAVKVPNMPAYSHRHGLSDVSVC